MDFARIVDDNQSMVVSLARRYLRDPDTAEEIAQDVFLQLYRQLDRIQTPEHATFWLRRAICHRSIDESRRQKLRPRLGLENIPEPPAETPEPDTMLNERLRRLVSNLADTPRMIVLLRYQEDLDPSEIAALLEMPVSTVKSHLHRSLAVLRSKLGRAPAAQEACS
jgi:RNA polymerase sigma-70 factor (ECF subfamily)